MMQTEAAAKELETYKWCDPGEKPGAADDLEQVCAAQPSSGALPPRGSHTFVNLRQTKRSIEVTMAQAKVRADPTGSGFALSPLSHRNFFAPAVSAVRALYRAGERQPVEGGIIFADDEDDDAEEDGGAR